MNPYLSRRSIVALGLASMTPVSRAASYPTQPVRLVVPFAPAGFVDIVGRLIADKVSLGLGQPVLVDNKPGAAGNIGTAFVAKAAPDGHTLLLGFDGTLVINPSIYPKAGFNSLNDFAPVLKLADAGLLMVASPGVGFKNLRELIAHAKSSPDKPLLYATSGVGSTPHLAGELLAQQAGIRLIHVPYKGGGQAMADVIAGQVPLCITALATALPYLESGRLVALGATSPGRIKASPNVPTFQESGLPGFAVTSWVGILAPAKTPPEVIDRLHKEFIRTLSKPETRERFQQLGLEAIGNSPEAFSKQIRADLDRYARVVKAAGITADN
jgi:tripartite-type tricarboxylate transporter receptor subunit TctC